MISEKKRCVAKVLLTISEVFLHQNIFTSLDIFSSCAINIFAYGGADFVSITVTTFWWYISVPILK